MPAANPRVVIAGGGIVGLSAACALAARGAEAIVLDRGTAGQEASYAAGGILSPQAEAPPGSPLLPLALRGRDLHVRLAEELRSLTGLDVEHRRLGVLSLAFSEEEFESLRRLTSDQQAQGLPARLASRDELRVMEPAASPDAVGAALFPEDHSVDNRKLVDAFRALAASRGVKVVEECEVRGIETSGDHVTGVRTDRETIATSRVINALGAWARHLEGDPRPAPVRPVKGHMMSIVGGPAIRHVVYGHHGYLIPRADGRLIVGSTMEEVGFDKTITDAGLKRLREIADSIAPEAAHATVAETWTGLRPATPDGLPLIGPGAVKGLVIAGGLFRNGILVGPLVGEIAAAIALDDDPGIDLSAFDPARF